jgi:GNAT superfamily N-acetyltransferase
MSPTTTFRECTGKDITRVQELVDELYVDDPGSLPARPQIQLTFEHFAASPNAGKIVVFEQSDRLVGYSILIFFWSNEFGGNIIEIDELLVTKDFRRRGISRMFFSWLDSQHPDCVGCALQVSAKNEDAARLYLDLGFAYTNQYLVKLRQPR